MSIQRRPLTNRNHIPLVAGVANGQEQALSDGDKKKNSKTRHDSFLVSPARRLYPGAKGWRARSFCHVGERLTHSTRVGG